MDTVKIKIHSKDIQKRVQKYGLLPFTSKHSIGVINEAFLKNDLVDCNYGMNDIRITIYDVSGTKNSFKNTYNDYPSILKFVQKYLRFDIIKAVVPTQITKIEVSITTDYRSDKTFNYVVNDSSNKTYHTYEDEGISDSDKIKEQDQKNMSFIMDQIFKKGK